MKLKSFFLSLVLTSILGLCFPYETRADSKFYLGGIYNMTSPQDGGTETYTSNAGLGGMAGVQGIFLGFPIELDLLYLQRAFSISTYSITATYLDVPLLLWLNIADFLSVGPGVYGSYGLNISRTGGASTSLTFQEAAMNSYSAGALAAARLNLFTNSSIGLFTEARYAYGLLNHATVGEFRYNDLLILVGLRFGSK